jgi:hypothetical protein
MKGFTAWIATLPSVNWKVFVGSTMFVAFCLTTFVCMVLGRTLNEGLVLAVGGIVLAYNGVTSYDFRTKRTTEIVTPPDVMASNTAAVTTAATPALPAAVPAAPRPTLAPTDAAVAHARRAASPPLAHPAGSPRAEAGEGDATAPVTQAPTPLPPGGP